MECGPEGAERINSFAVVAYIRGPLAGFLDGLRAELVPGCVNRAHVTILPPRPLIGDVPEVLELIGDRVQDVPAFQIEATRIRVFPITQVIYADIASGTSALTELHDRLNVDGLFFEEPFEYHPHLTLAQGLEAGEVTPLVELAERRWREFPHSRTFVVDNITFVQNTLDNRWLDVAQWKLPKRAEVLSR
jgi:2'-5' RNA ligase